MGLIKAIISVASACSGFGTALIWVAQGEYSSDCATEETEGFYYGYFWAWFMMAETIGNPVGAVLITRAQGPVFYLILGVVLTVGALLFLCLPDIIPINYDESVHASSRIKKSATSVKEKGFWATVISTAKLTVSKKMMFVNLTSFSAGASMVAYTGLLTPFFVLILNNDVDYKDIGLTDNEKNAYALFALSALGVGEVLGGIVTGLVIDRCGLFFTIFAAIVIYLLMAFMVYLNLTMLKYGVISFALTFIVGLSDSLINVINFRVLGHEFENSSEPFGAFHILQGFGCITFMLV